MTASVGAIVKLYFDTLRVLEENMVVRSAATGRCYRITAVRQQETGKHAGRWHVQGLVLGNPEDEQHGPGCAGCQILGLLIRVQELETQLATALADE